MRPNCRPVMVLFTVVLIASFGITEVFAQAPRAGGRPPIEFSTTYGTMWGGNIGIGGGKIRTGTGGSWGFALDVPVARGQWLEASYNRQEGSLDWDPQGQPLETLSDMTVNIWHLGSIRTLGRPGSPVIPYVQGSLGATFFSPSESEVILDGESFTIDGTTKFSIAFGVGFKAYLGEAKRFGLRGSFKVISSLFDSGGGVWFGPGGVQLGVSGSGIWQYEAAGGLTIKFGG